MDMGIDSRGGRDYNAYRITKLYARFSHAY